MRKIKMDKEVEQKIFELLEVIGEALEHQMKTEDSRILKEDISEGRKCVEKNLNVVLPYSITDRIDTESLSDADWLLEIYRVMDEIKQPFLIQNLYDKEFFALLNYIWNNSREKLVEVMKNNLLWLKGQNFSAYNRFVTYFARFPLWGTIHPEQGDYQTLEFRAAVLKQRSYEFLWLYRRLEDYLSKRTLYAILRRLHKEGLTNLYYSERSHGPKRKYYKITEKGEECLKQYIASWHEIEQIFDELGL